MHERRCSLHSRSPVCGTKRRRLLCLQAYELRPAQQSTCQRTYCTKHGMHTYAIRCVNEDKCKPGTIEARPSPRAATAILILSAEASLSQYDSPQGTREVGKWCPISPSPFLSFMREGCPRSQRPLEPVEHPFKLCNCAAFGSLAAGCAGVIVNHRFSSSACREGRCREESSCWKTSRVASSRVGNGAWRGLAAIEAADGGG